MGGLIFKEKVRKQFFLNDQILFDQLGIIITRDLVVKVKKTLYYNLKFFSCNDKILFSLEEGCLL